MRLQLLSTTSNAARRVNFLLQIWLSGGFSRRFAKTYDYPPFPAPAQTSPRPRIRESLAPFCRAPPLLAPGWGSLARAARAATGTPPPRSRKTSRKEQEFDPARVSGEHTTGNKRAAAAPSVSTSARERASSCIAPAPRRRRNKQKTSHAARGLRHAAHARGRGPRRRHAATHEGQTQNDKKEEARNPTKSQGHARGAHPKSSGGRR